MNPPLRSKEDRDALLQGLLDGTIDFIATDHAPHADEENAVGLLEAPFGIVGLETAFSLLYTLLVKKNIITLSPLVASCTKTADEVFGLPDGTLVEGAIADRTLVNLERNETIDKPTFYSKGKNTPFHGWNVFGIPELTIAAGKIVYEDER